MGDESASLYSIVNSYNEDVRWAYNQMEVFNRSISYSEIQCYLYNIEINPGMAGNLRLAQWFVDEVQSLPKDLTGENLIEYHKFFTKYGDHVYTKCTMGGLINQFLSTDYAYWANKSIDEIRELSENTFMVGVERSKKDKFKIDPKFLEASHLRPYKYFGGAFPEFEDNWNPWSTSILEGSHNNIVCTNFEAVPITDFLELDHRTLPQKENMKKAMNLILNKPMCNHIIFSETEPKLSIMKLTDMYQCSK